MKIQDIVQDRLEVNLERLGPEVLIDCGHTAVSFANGEFRFGGNTGPSSSEVRTLQMGLEIASWLIASGRSASPHVCLCDTTRNLRDSSKRAELKERIERGEMFELLPRPYREIIEGSLIDPEDFIFSLQTRNSNTFSSWIKNVKKNINAAVEGHASVFRYYHALFLKDPQDDLFGFSTPFLFDIDDEVDEDYEPSERELVKSPLLQLKQLKVVNLYSKSSGILCPGTYGGLLLNAEGAPDHVAVYSRNDDTYIGEKILRGVVAANILNPAFGRKCLQVILPKHLSTPEISLITPEQIRAEHHPDFDNFIEKYFEPQLGNRYRSYT